MVQLKDVTPIIRAILDERDKIPWMINTERYIPNWQPYHDGEYMRGGIRKALRIIEQAPVVDAVEVVRCRDCKYCAVCGNGLHVCKAHDLHLLRTTPDGYCHMGAKMEGGPADAP